MKADALRIPNLLKKPATGKFSYLSLYGMVKWASASMGLVLNPSHTASNHSAVGFDGK